MPSSNSSLDTALWTLSTGALLLIVNPLNESITAEIPGMEVRVVVLDAGPVWEGVKVVVQAYGVGGWEVEVDEEASVRKSEETNGGTRSGALGMTLPWDREL